MERTYKRNINLDLIRVISMLFVVLIHAWMNPLKSHSLPACIYITIIYTCNHSFYMLSGQLNLSRPLSDKRDYIRYYVKKTVSILFPYILITCLMSLWDMYHYENPITITSYLSTTYKAFMFENESKHLWFMYPLIGLLLSAPFLSKLLSALSDWEIKLLFFIALGWNFISIYLVRNFDLYFAYSGWLLGGWTTTFFAGYFCNRIIGPKNKRNLYIAGSIGFLVTVLSIWKLSDYIHSETEYAAAYILFAMAFYTFLKDEIVIKNNYIQKGISFLARYSFLVYMLHWNILHRITPRIVTTTSPVFSVLGYVFVTLLLSYIAAIFLDLCIIHPIQKALLQKLLPAPKKELELNGLTGGVL